MRSCCRTLVAGAIISLIASCGGSAGPQGNKDATTDTPIGNGDGANDRPADGGTGDGGGDSSGGDGGGMVGHALGTSCLLATECESGFCVDGVCCDGACSDVCFTCALQGAVGTCMPADVGTDPRNECDDMGVQSCGSDGVCDGTGACHKYPSGVVCTPQSCMGTMLKAAARCDGDGACVGLPPRPARRSCAGPTASAW